MPGGLITLTTDFGTADHFAGVMKGVILGIAPRARIVDITHEIAPYAAMDAAFVIAQAWRYFPKRTIHVIVVDPGVGSARRPILAEAEGHFFIAPDNGVLSMIYEDAKTKVRVISNPKMMLNEVSRTFHGRDVFAPAAAHLARGVPAARFGKLIHDALRFSGWKPSKISRNVSSGIVLKVDRFGNLITNFHIHAFPEVRTRPFELRIGRERVHRLALTFSEAELGELFMIVGSSGYFEIAANQASAAERLSCGAGTPVELEIST
ncbi:MAG TPA: SAM-dependent chlorinase/fluorinase [Bryobacteraceae bacterium]|nr:SAM-dependent chlorinase/fluorinase [Bryobacteraceae bacterium]